MKQEIKELTGKLKNQGFRVFIAKRGSYGFFCKDDSKIISFQADLGGISFSGNYTTNKPQQTGTGWRLSEGLFDYSSMLDSQPPSWAVQDSKWNFTTLQKHIKSYQRSSIYKEIKTSTAC